MKEKTKFQVRGNYINGRFESSADPSGEWLGKSPADFNDALGVFKYSYADVDRAVASANTAFKKWKKEPLEKRMELLKRYQANLRQRNEEFLEALAREIGKPLWEAATEISAMVNKVDVTIQESLKLVTDYQVPKILPGTTGATRYRPHGVMLVLGPYNFPAHLPNGHIVPALLMGNCVIFKPSEKAPLVAQLMAECFDAAGFPPGVFNLVQGEKEVGRRLCVHEGVDGILFTGSYEVGTRIKQDTLQQHWKILALEMGGKNAAIIWKDADLDLALKETFFGAFVTAGQRCSATSRVIVHESMLESYLQKLHQRAKAFVIGHPLANPFMGPLIDATTVDRYVKFQGIAVREGGELVMRGRTLKLEFPGNYVTPSICWVKENSLEATKKSVYQQTELFSPNVAVLGTSDLDQAIALANATQYGLVSSVFTKDRATYEYCASELEFGLMNWNRATVGASSRLPFGGLKKSGNHFPTALNATLYCAYPVASLESEEASVDMTKYPGCNWSNELKI